MENRIKTLFDGKREGILSVYFCAGDPDIDGTVATVEALERAGVDMVEIGMPFSDPIADGPVIQGAAANAIRQGMSVGKLFGQLKDIRARVKMPLLLMGYYNVAYHYGMERFFERCAECGIDGLIIPDMPFEEYVKDYAAMAERYGVKMVFLVTPETSEDRIRQLDEATDGFIYAVSSASVTGAQKEFGEAKEAYFARLASMGLRNPWLIGFGISNRQTRQAAEKYARGVIVGSKFVTLLEEFRDPAKAASELLEALAK